VFLGGRPARSASPEADPRGPLAAADPPAPEADTPAGTPRPASAAEALDRAAAAYEFGDLHQMIDLARLVAEGALPGNDDQRATALRLLGIGLYLDGRVPGAEKAFVDLIKLRPRANLDASVTRPEVVGFFRDVRRRHGPQKHLVLAFLPPFGQFQNDTPVRGWILGGLEAATLATAATTSAVLYSWRKDHDLCKGGSDTAPCDRMRSINHVAVAALAATWAVGVVDALLNHNNNEPESMHASHRPTAPPNFALTILPAGAALRVSF
jgi:hypothetical protein